MNKDILIIFKDRDLQDTIKECLETELINEFHTIVVDCTTNQAEAFNRVQQRNYDLIITHLHIPLDNKSPLIEEEQRGILFLKELISTYNKSIPSILVSVSKNKNLFAAIRSIHQCQLVLEGSELWEEDLIASANFALKLSTSQAILSDKANPKKVNIDFFISPDKAEGKCFFKGNASYACDEAMAFKINKKEIILI